MGQLASNGKQRISSSLPCFARNDTGQRGAEGRESVALGTAL